jgi:excisionase family DNA binding protein
MRQGQAVEEQPDNVLTIDELSVYLKIAKSTLYKLAQEGRLPGQKVGRHWRFHREAIDAWLRRNSPSSEPKGGRQP